MKKIVFALMGGLFCVSGAFRFEPSSISQSRKFLLGTATLKASDKNEDAKFLGKGYDITSGSPIFKAADSIKFQNPIFDEKKEYLSSVSVTDVSESHYESGSSSSKKKISEDMGKLYSGGIGANVSVKKVNVNLNAAFNTQDTKNWSSVQQETYSYHDIIASRKVVALRNPTNYVLSNFLSDDFKNDALQVKDKEEAKTMLSKYGTHLITAYSLGGIFEMTNYFASSSASYVRKNNTGFDAQIQAGLGSMASGNVSFSFSNQYAKEDNSDVSTCQYKLSTYGGKLGTNATMDQAFTLLGSEVFGKQGYAYQIWTDSINDSFALTIVSTPANSLIPLYEVLPETKDYDVSRECLLEAYIEKCATCVADYNQDNPDIKMTGLKEKTEETPQLAATIHGFQRYKKMDDGTRLVSYSKIGGDSEESQIKLSAGDTAFLDYKINNEALKRANWKFVLTDDKTEGKVSLSGNHGEIVNVSSEAPKGTFTIQMKLNDNNTVIKRVKGEITNQDFTFSGGDGTEKNPYLISSNDDLKTLSEAADTETGKALLKNGNHFKLVNDLDCKGLDFKGIGREDVPFEGFFDGAYHTINNLTILSKNEDSGFFNKCSGTAQNLFLNHVEMTVNQKDKGWPLKNIGLFAGRLSSSKGKIIDCSLKGNSTLKIDMCDKDCNGKTDGKEGSENTLCVGMSIGLLENDASVNLFKIEGGSLSATTTRVANLNVGGFIGKIAGGSKNFLKNISIKDVGLKCNNGDNNRSANIKSDKLGRQIDVCFGGFIGEIESKTNVDGSEGISFIDVVLKNKDGFEFDSNIESSNIFDQLKCVFNVSGFIGKTNSALNKVNQVFVDINGNSIKNGEGVTMYHTASVFNGVSQNSDDWKNICVINYDNTSDKGSTGEIKNVGESSFKNQIENTILEDVIFKTDDVQKDFIKGDEFNANGIEATAYFRLSDGSTKGETINNFFVDYSNFEKNSIGTYTILLKYGAFISSYDVNVIEPTAKSFKAQLKDSNKKYYDGDAFDKTDIKATANYTDCTVKSVDPQELKITNETKTEQSNDKDKLKLSAGQNKIVISYLGFSTYLIVNAEEKVASEISIEKTPTKMRYRLSDKNVDLDGLAIKVKYKTDNKYNSALDETILYSSTTKNNFEAFHSRFRLGNNNEIKISYGDYLTASYEVEVVQNNARFNQEVKAFSENVKTISTIENLEEKFTAIQTIANQRQKIIQIAFEDGLIAKMSEEINDITYQKASAELDNQIQEYNALISSINDDFDHSISDSSSFVIGNLENFIGALLKAICAFFSRLFGLA